MAIHEKVSENILFAKIKLLPFPEQVYIYTQTHT